MLYVWIWGGCVQVLQALIEALSSYRSKSGHVEVDCCVHLAYASCTYIYIYIYITTLFLHVYIYLSCPLTSDYIRDQASGLDTP